MTHQENGQRDSFAHHWTRQACVLFVLQGESRPRIGAQASCRAGPIASHLKAPAFGDRALGEESRCCSVLAVSPVLLEARLTHRCCTSDNEDLPAHMPGGTAALSTGQWTEGGTAAQPPKKEQGSIHCRPTPALANSRGRGPWPHPSDFTMDQPAGSPEE